MSRPLIATKPMGDKKAKARKIGAAEFHRRVFESWGPKCWRLDCSARAVGAAHIVPRSKLGPHRYACPKQNGRPLCRRHHDEQEAGLWDFPARIRRQAVDALNEILTVKLPVPV